MYYNLIVRKAIDLFPRTHHLFIIVTNDDNQIGLALDFICLFEDRQNVGALTAGCGTPGTLKRTTFLFAHSLRRRGRRACRPTLGCHLQFGSC
jgi:hypothetical protein